VFCAPWFETYGLFLSQINVVYSSAPAPRPFMERLHTYEWFDEKRNNKLYNTYNLSSSHDNRVVPMIMKKPNIWINKPDGSRSFKWMMNNKIIHQLNLLLFWINFHSQFLRLFFFYFDVLIILNCYNQLSWKREK
jgi:hypothetical protein